MTSFFGELRRRNVVRVAVAYAIVGWILVEVSSTVLPLFEAPDWIAQVFAFFTILGFPVALVLSWAYDLTPQGVVRADQVPLSESITKVRGRKLDFVIIGVLAIAVAFFAVERFVLEDSAEPQIVADESVEGSPPVVVEDQREVLPNSIAVLPFENLSPDPDNDYFAAGIHESTLNQLAKIRDLTVIARTSVLQYEDDPPPIPEIAEALKVEMVMEGSVRYANERVLITAQLIDGRTGAHLWSNEYNRDLMDVFAVQAEIAENIAMALEAEVLASEHESMEKPPTDSTEAYEHYLRALSLPNFSVFPQALAAYINSLDRALAVDPEFAEAYALRARGYIAQGDLSGALDDARRAIELDPTIGRAYSARALVYRDYYDRQDEARVAHERSVELSPNDAEILIEYARFLAYSEEYAEAIRVGNQAIAIDPEDFAHHDRLGIVYMLSRDFPAAARQFRQGIDVNSAAGSAHMFLAATEFASGNTARAMNNLNHAAQIWQPTPVFGLAGMAYLYGRLGEPDQAARLAAELDDLAIDRLNPSQAQLPWATLGTGNREGALREWTDLVDGYLEEGLPADPSPILNFKTNFLLDPILDQPEFVEVRSRLEFRE